MEILWKLDIGKSCLNFEFHYYIGHQKFPQHHNRISGTDIQNYGKFDGAHSGTASSVQSVDTIVSTVPTPISDGGGIGIVPASRNVRFAQDY